MSTKLNISHKAIKQLLNASLARLGQPTLSRLRDARAQAMARHDIRQRARQMTPAFAGAGNAAWHAVGSRYKTHLLVAGVLIMVMLFSVAAYRQQQAAENDVAEVDLSILIDDLPMHVYLD